MSALVEASEGQRRFALTAFATFAVAALALAGVLRQGMILTGVGIGAGLAAAAAFARGLSALLFGVGALDPLTYPAEIGLIAAVSAIACVVPASRALRVDPCVALRAE